MSDSFVKANDRIVSLVSGGTEMLFAMGLGDRVAAVSHECDFPPGAANKLRATRSRIDSSRSSQEIDVEVRTLLSRGEPLYELNEELLVEVAPELIVTQAQCEVCAISYEDVMQLVGSRPELAATRVLALNPNRFEDLPADIRRLGVAAGAGGAAAECAGSLEGRIEKVRAQTAELAPHDRPRVACLEWLDPLMLSANWMPELVELAGGTSVLAEAGKPSAYSTWSELAACDPEVLIIMPCGFDLDRALQEAAELRRQPIWHGFSVARARRVFAVDGNAFFNRCGPRLVESLEILAHLLHPELFGPPLAPAERERAWQRLLP